MLTFPLHNAALALKGKPPEELPHGLLPIPPEVRELVERERAKFPHCSEEVWGRTLNRWAVGWYFDGLGQEVIYRETPAGPEVLAVGMAETCDLWKRLPLEEQLRLEIYQD
ncbi:MAG TPA: hypothetical protein VFW33_24015 [Gemmataceae bacterium]|nr:hypothetical protein [Gemmataceae bacterium]